MFKKYKGRVAAVIMELNRSKMFRLYWKKGLKANQVRKPCKNCNQVKAKICKENSKENQSLFILDECISGLDLA